MSGVDLPHVERIARNLRVIIYEFFAIGPDEIIEFFYSY